MGFEGSPTQSSIMDEAQADGRDVHFGSLMELCSNSNSQLEKDFWNYKGRIVFKGGTIDKDGNGQFAAFTEQGTSASPLAAANSRTCVQTAWPKWRRL